MLPDEYADVRASLVIAHQKLQEIISESESKDNCVQTLYKIASVQSDLKAIAHKLLKCHLRTSLQLIGTGDTSNLDEELKTVIEEYKVWQAIT